MVQIGDVFPVQIDEEREMVDAPLSAQSMPFLQMPDQDFERIPDFHWARVVLWKEVGALP